MNEVTDRAIAGRVFHLIPRAAATLAAALVLVCLVLPGPVGAEELYSYKDDQGVTHVIKNPDQAPARYRHTLKKVGGNLSVVGGESRERGRQADWLEPRGPATVILVALWRSRLGFSLAGAAALVLLAPLGMIWARSLTTRKERIRYAITLPGFALAAVVFLWLGLAGRQAVKFTREVEAGAARALSTQKVESGKKPGLERLRKAGSEWEGILVKACYDPPE